MAQPIGSNADWSTGSACSGGLLATTYFIFVTRNWSRSLIMNSYVTEKEMTKMSVSNELEKLSKLKETGAINEEKFQAPGRSGSGDSRISTRSTVSLFASAFCLLHLFGCDLLVGGGTDREGDGEGEPPQCQFTNDGKCDEPTVCPPGTDTNDCSLCDGCCRDPNIDCRASEVCRFQEDDIIDAGDGIGTCVSADGIVYSIFVGATTMCEADPNGAEWDIGAGAPDPIVSIQVNGLQVAASPVIQDRFNFDPSFVTDIVLRSTDSISIIVFDEDFSDNDFGGGFCLGSACDAPVGVETLRGVNESAQGTCTPGGVASMELSLFPTPN